jgi:heme exporter protein A
VLSFAGEFSQRRVKLFLPSPLFVNAAQTAMTVIDVLPALPATAVASTRPGVLAGVALACKRGRRLLFSGLGLRLDPGSVTWLRGRNGSGKTSLMRILAGLSAPYEGDVTWNAEPVRRHREEARSGVFYIGHANALKDELTLAESVEFLARLHGLECARERAHDALTRLGLAGRRDALVATLSQGQRRRGALARLMLDDEPRTWILDEPFDALDLESVALLGRLITDHADRGGAVLLTSHQLVDLGAAQTFDLEPFLPQR